MAKRGRRPVVVKQISDLIRGVAALGLFGCLCLVCVALFAGEPTVPECGCGRAVVVTLADRLAGESLFGALGVCVLCIGVGVARLWGRAVRAVPASTLCERLGLDLEGLRRYTEQRGIEPRFVIGDQPHYELSDFGEAATLLRASAAAGPDELLRASGSGAAVPPEDLLRAAHPISRGDAEARRDAE